jgi:hypothetical protein
MLRMLNKTSFYILLFFFLSILFDGSLYSQTKSNLEVFYSLADSSLNMIGKKIHLPSTQLKLELNNGDIYSVFNNHIREYLTSKKAILVSEKNENVTVLSYSIEKASTEYFDLFRNGFLGSYMVHRNLSLKCNYFITASRQKDSNYTSEFNYSQLDSINVDDIKNFENSSFKFTCGTIPPEPFFTGLFEPVFALGTAAAAVILFFKVRSK